MAVFTRTSIDTVKRVAREADVTSTMRWSGARRGSVHLPVEDRPESTLEYDVTDAATGGPMRVTILSGVIALAVEQEGMFRVVSRGLDHRQQMGGSMWRALRVYRRGTTRVELSLSQVGVRITAAHKTWMHGHRGARPAGR